MMFGIFGEPFMKQKIVLIVSVAIGLIAALLTRSYVNSLDRKYREMQEDFDKRNKKIPVIIAKGDLPSGTVLSHQDLLVDDVIANVVRGKAVEEKDQMLLLGRKTTQPLSKHAVIYWADIEGGAPALRGLASDIKEKMRGISVNVSGAAAVSGMVQPNDHIDVIGTFSFPSKTVPGELELETLTILQDVLVLATGKETAKSRLLFAGNTSAASYNTVTLEVTPREAEMLAFLDTMKGRIYLTLRNPNDVYFEVTLPRVNFEKIRSEIEDLNDYRQKNIHRKRAN